MSNFLGAISLHCVQFPKNFLRFLVSVAFLMTIAMRHQSTPEHYGILKIPKSFIESVSNGVRGGFLFRHCRFPENPVSQFSRCSAPKNGIWLTKYGSSCRLDYLYFLYWQTEECIFCFYATKSGYLSVTWAYVNCFVHWLVNIPDLRLLWWCSNSGFLDVYEMSLKLQLTIATTFTWEPCKNWI